MENPGNCSLRALRYVAKSRAANHRVAGSTNGSTNGLDREVQDSQLVDSSAKVALVRDGSVVLPKQMRYQTAPCPVPVPREFTAGRHPSRFANARNTMRRFCNENSWQIMGLRVHMLISQNADQPAE